MGITFTHSMKNAFAIERSRMQIRRVTASARFLRARSSLYDIFPPNISPEKKITSPIIFHFTGDVTYFYFQFPFSDNLYFPTDESGFSIRNSIRILYPELYPDPLPELYQTSLPGTLSGSFPRTLSGFSFRNSIRLLYQNSIRLLYQNSIRSRISSHIQ